MRDSFSNTTRANWAGEAVEAYLAESEPDNEAAVRDLISDLLHLLHQSGFDAMEELRIAGENFCSEIEPEQVPLNETNEENKG